MDSSCHISGSASLHPEVASTGLRLNILHVIILAIFGFRSAFLQLLHDVVYMNLKGIKSTTGDITRRVINITLVGLVALGCAIGALEKKALLPRRHYRKKELLHEEG